MNSKVLEAVMWKHMLSGLVTVLAILAQLILISNGSTSWTWYVVGSRSFLLKVLKLIIEVSTTEEQCLFHKEIKGIMEMDEERWGRGFEVGFVKGPGF